MVVCVITCQVDLGKLAELAEHGLDFVKEQYLQTKCKCDIEKADPREKYKKKKKIYKKIKSRKDNNKKIKR